MTWEKGFLTTHPGAPLPTNDTIQALHQKAKENYDKARAAWEEGRLGVQRKWTWIKKEIFWSQ